MASTIGMALRADAAQGRIAEAIDALSARLGVEIAPLPSDHRDPIAEPTLRLEWIAETLEALSDAVPAKRAAKAKGDAA